MKTTEKKEYKMKNILNQAGEFHFSQFDSDNDNNDADNDNNAGSDVVEEAEAGGTSHTPPLTIATATLPQIRHLIRLAYCNAVLQGLLLGSFALLGILAVTIDWQERLGANVIARYLEQGYSLLKYEIQPQLGNVTNNLILLKRMLNNSEK